MVEEKKEVENEVQIDDDSGTAEGLYLILAGVAGLIAYYFIGGLTLSVLAFSACLITASIVFTGMEKIGDSQGWFKVTKREKNIITVANHRCCIQCKHPVKDIS